MENFDNKELNKQMNIIKNICILLVIVSVIGFLCAGDMINSILIDNDSDDVEYKIDDYYGIYYWISDKYECWSLELGLFGCHIVRDTGIGTAEEDYSSRYISSDEAKAMSLSNDYYGCEAIVIYKYDWSSWSYMLWITNDGIVLDNRAETYTPTTKELTFKDVCNDPQNYYGTYVYNENNYINIEENGIANLYYNATYYNFSRYSYVNKLWLAEHMAEEDDSWTDETIIVYHYLDPTNAWLFHVQPDGTLMLGNRIYTKAASD